MRRRGLTVAELLVVIAIIVVLVALLLPALSSRGPSSRSLCSSHLHNLSVALANYMDIHGCAPAGADRQGFGPFPYLLPYMDGLETYERINFRMPPTGVENATVRRTTLPLLLCPSDPARPGAGTNYLGNAGPSHTLAFAEQFQAEKLRGVFFAESWLAPKQLTDNHLKTIAFAETLRGAPGFAEFPGAPPNPIPPATGAGHPPLLTRGDTWMEGRHLRTLGLFALMPNSPHADTSYDGGQGGAAAARSAHPGGANVVMLDATTRFVADNVDPAVWKALTTSAGGEMVADF